MTVLLIVAAWLVGMVGGWFLRRILEPKHATRIVYGVKQVENRKMPDFNRAQRRAHKRRRREPTG